MRFRPEGVEALSSENHLRPETVESLFVLWRVTGKEKYRDMAWNIFQVYYKRFIYGTFFSFTFRYLTFKVKHQNIAAKLFQYFEVLLHVFKKLTIRKTYAVNNFTISNKYVI